MSEVLPFPTVVPRHKRLAECEGYLLGRILGQEDAIRRVSAAVVDAELGLNDVGARPKAAFLLMGPTGVGKTETCKGMADFLELKLAMAFMNEYQSLDSVRELVAWIRRAIQDNPKGAVLLFDEFEKAHPAIIDLFLSLLDEGQLTDGSERLLLGNCYVNLTSNVGSKRFAEMETTAYATMEQYAYQAARQAFRPELFARLTETVVYRPLNQEVQIQILRQMSARKLEHLRQVMARHLRLGQAPSFKIDPKSVQAHLLRTGFSTTGGARRLRQELDRQFNHAVRSWLLSAQVPKEWCFYADARNNCLVLK